MKLKRLLRHLAFALTPRKYKEIVGKKFGQVVGLYFLVWAISLVLLFLTGFIYANWIAQPSGDVYSPAIGPFSVNATTPSSLTMLWVLLPGLAFMIGLLVFAGSVVLSVFSATIAKIIRGKKLVYRNAWVASVHALLLPILLLGLFLAFSKVFVLVLVLSIIYLLIYVLAIALLDGYTF